MIAGRDAALRLPRMSTTPCLLQENDDQRRTLVRGHRSAASLPAHLEDSLPLPDTLFYAAMKVPFQIGFAILLTSTAQAQIQVELKIKRLEYVAHEPVVATV